MPRRFARQRKNHRINESLPGTTQARFPFAQPPLASIINNPPQGKGQATFSANDSFNSLLRTSEDTRASRPRLPTPFFYPIRSQCIPPYQRHCQPPAPSRKTLKHSYRRQKKTMKVDHTTPRLRSPFLLLLRFPRNRFRQRLLL